MYVHDAKEQQDYEERLAEFAEQTRRHLAGRLSEAEFRPLRLRLGLCIRRHAPLLRVALPFGHVSAKQLRALAGAARRWDRRYAHFNAQQQVEFNWLQRADVPAILAELAAAHLHSVPAGGETVMQIAAEPLAGMAPEEVFDPLPWGEAIRQWAMRHRQDLAIPARRFTLAISAKPGGLASLGAHDIGLQALVHSGRPGFALSANGLMIHAFVPGTELLNHLRKILSVGQGKPETVSNAMLAHCAARFSRSRHARDAAAVEADGLDVNAPHAGVEPRFAAWLRSHVVPLRRPGRVAVHQADKAGAGAPGDLSADQMEALASLAERYGSGELRAARNGPLLLVDMRRSALYPLWRELDLLGLTSPRTARPAAPVASTPLQQALRERVAALDHSFDLGELDLEVPLRVLGTAFSPAQQPDAMERILQCYLALRDSEVERLIDVLERAGIEPFQHVLAEFQTSTQRELP